MESIIYATISVSEFSRIFGVGTSTIAHWKTQGLPVRADGRISLQLACRWVREQHAAELAEQRRDLILTSLTQKELCWLTCRSRATLLTWGRLGMPRNKDKTYNLVKVVRWIQNYHAKRWPKLISRMKNLCNELSKEVCHESH